MAMTYDKPVLYMTRCMEGAPVWMTSPYFYQSPQFLRDDLEDFGDPVPELHETTLDIEPITGIAVSLHKRIQVHALHRHACIPPSPLLPLL